MKTTAHSCADEGLISLGDFEPEAKVARVCVIVLNWNRRALTLACLESLQQTTYPATRLVMVDNGSTDDSIEAVQRLMPQVHVVENKANLGYAGGNNAAIRHCLENFDDEFFLILNNDTVVAPDFITHLVEATHREPRGGVFGPKILRADKRDVISSAGGRWDDASANFLHEGDGEIDRGQFDQPGKTGYLTGCAILVRREVMKQLGGFDERFFLYYEDADLSYRIRKQGLECIYVPTSRIWHAVSSSVEGPSPLKSYFVSRNRLLFASEHLSMATFARLSANILLESLIPAICDYPSPGTSLSKRIYWIVGKKDSWSLRRYRDPNYLARLYGIRDYFMGNLGDCPPQVRAKLVRFNAKK